MAEALVPMSRFTGPGDATEFTKISEWLYWYDESTLLLLWLAIDPRFFLIIGYMFEIRLHYYYIPLNNLDVAAHYDPYW